MKKVGPWILTDCRCGAYRALLGTDGEDIANRVAFIEKTPRIRVHADSKSVPDHLCWASGPFKGDGPDDEESREWCDTALVLFGYEVPDSVIELPFGSR